MIVELILAGVVGALIAAPIAYLVGRRKMAAEIANDPCEKSYGGTA